MPDSCVERIGRGARADESRRHGSLRNGAQLGTAKTGTDAEAVLARTNGLLWSRVALAAAALVPAGVLAQSTTQIDDHVVVLGRWDNPFGYNVTASQGVVGAAELEARPRLRTGEILEVVPGLIVTQHSGDGQGEPVCSCAASTSTTAPTSRRGSTACQ